MEFDDDNNLIDPITLDLIPADRAILFDQNGVTFCFDIEYLSQCVKKGNTTNPMNRVQLDATVLSEIDAYTLRRRIAHIPIVRRDSICGYFDIYKWDNVSRLVEAIKESPKFKQCTSIQLRELNVGIIDMECPIEDRRVSIIIQ